MAGPCILDFHYPCFEIHSFIWLIYPILQGYGIVLASSVWDKCSMYSWFSLLCKGVRSISLCQEADHLSENPSPAERFTPLVDMIRPRSMPTAHLRWQSPLTHIKNAEIMVNIRFIFFPQIYAAASDPSSDNKKHSPDFSFF